jgi:sugar lactone lactonase YvrE
MTAQADRRGLGELVDPDAPLHLLEHGFKFTDGTKCDEQGNVWCTGPGGVWEIDPAGEPLGVLSTPENAGDLAWGGLALRSLFLACSTSLYVVETTVAGAALPCH